MVKAPQTVMNNELCEAEHNTILCRSTGPRAGRRRLAHRFADNGHLLTAARPTCGTVKRTADRYIKLFLNACREYRTPRAVQEVLIGTLRAVW